MAHAEMAPDLAHREFLGPAQRPGRTPRRAQAGGEGRRDRGATPSVGHPGAPGPSSSLRRRRSSPAVDLGQASTARSLGCLPLHAGHCASLAPGSGSSPLDQPHRPQRRGLLDETVELVCRLARENPRWGYVRIAGECAKVGVGVSVTLGAQHLAPPSSRPRSPTGRAHLGRVLAIPGFGCAGV